jgi:hypothetical protein
MWAGLVTVGMLVSAPGGAGAHSFPVKAKTLRADLVQGYPQCTSPNAQTSAGRPACLESEELDPSCLFGDRGAGMLAATISKSNIKLRASVKGLDPGCEGKTLIAALTVRATTDDCPMEHCTVVDYDVTGGSCTVRKGKCTLSASVPTGYPAGAGSEMTVVSCGLKNGDATTFTCGVMVK